MSFVSYFTPNGLARIAHHTTNQTKLVFQDLLLGNGRADQVATGYATYTPTPTQAALVNHRLTIPVTGVRVLGNQIFVQARKPPGIGGAFVTEMALRDAQGYIVAIASTPAVELVAGTQLGEIGAVWEFIATLQNASSVIMQTNNSVFLTIEDAAILWEGGGVKELIHGSHDLTWSGTGSDQYKIPLGRTIDLSRSEVSVSLGFSHYVTGFQINIAHELVSDGIILHRHPWGNTNINIKARYTVKVYGVNTIALP